MDRYSEVSMLEVARLILRVDTDNYTLSPHVIRNIKRLRELGLSLKDAKDLLEEVGAEQGLFGARSATRQCDRCNGAGTITTNDIGWRAPKPQIDF